MLAVTLLGGHAWSQQSGTYINGNGSWGTAANWQAGIIADGMDSTGTFRGAAAASYAVDLDVDRTIGYLLGNHVNNGYRFTLNPNGCSLTLQTTPPAVPGITVSSGHLTVALPLLGTQGVNIASTANPITLASSSSTYSGDTTLWAGRLRLGGDAGTNAPVANGVLGTGRLIMKNGTLLSSDSTAGRLIYNEVVLDGNATVGDGVDYGPPTFRGPITLTGDRTWNSVGVNSTFIEGIIDDGPNDYQLTVTGTRALYFRSQSTYGGGTVLNRGTGATHVGANTTGDPPVNGPLGTGPVRLVTGVLTADGATPRTLSNPFYLDGDVTLGMGVTHYGILTFTRPVTVTGNRILTLAQNSSNYEVFQGGITDNGNGWQFTLRGYSGWLRFGGTNTMGGGIRVYDAEFTLEPQSVWAGVPLITLGHRQANLRFQNTTGVGANGPPVLFSRSTPIVWNQGNAGGTWTVPSLTRGGRATLVVAGHASGSIYMGPAGPLGATDRFKVTSAPPAVHNGMVAPYFVESTTDFLTYDDAGRGFQRAVYTVTNAINSAGAMDLLFFNAAQTLNSSRAIYAVRGELNGIANGAGGPYTLTLGSGALHIRTGTTATQTVEPHIRFGPAGEVEGFVFAGKDGDSQALSLTGSLIGTNGVTFSGYVPTLLGGDSRATLSGPVTVNSGTLRLGASERLPAETPLAINGGTFDLNGFTQTVGRLSFSGGNVYNSTGDAGLVLPAAIGYDGDYEQGLVYPNTGGPALGAVLTGPTTFTVADGYSAGSIHNPDLAFGGNIGGTWRRVILAGTGSIRKRGPGFMQLTSSTNTFVGDVHVEEGILDGVIGSNPGFPFGDPAGNRIYIERNGILSFNVTSGGNVTYLSEVRFSGGNGLRGRTGGTAGIAVRLNRPATIERQPGSHGTLRLTGYLASGANDDWNVNHSLTVYEWTNASPLVNGMLPAYWVHTGWNSDNELGAFVTVSSSARVLYAAPNRTTFTGALTTERIYLAASEGLDADKAIWALQTAYDVPITGGSPTLTLGSGGLIVNGTNTLAPNLTFGSGGTGEGLVFVAGLRTATLSGRLTTSGGLTKFGNGVLSLTADNSATLSGEVWVNNGTLRLSNAGALAASSPINIERGASLDIAGNYTLDNAIAGLGSITTGSNLLTLAAAGSLAPGFTNSVGTLTVEDLDFGGAYRWDYDETTNDVVACTSLAFGGSPVLNVNWLGAGQAPIGTYTLFTYLGADPVNPSWTVNAPSGLLGTVSVDSAAKRVILELCPKPSGTWFRIR